VARLVKNLVSDLSYRKNTTAVAGLICGLNPCATTSEDYDNHSTNSRDARLLHTYDALMKTINDAGGINDASVQKAISGINSLDDILLAGFDYTYRDFIFSPALLKNIKADANLNYNLRWGLGQFPSVEAQFKFYNQQLMITLQDRVSKVGEAIYYCLSKPSCDPLSEPMKALNTSKMDQGFSLLANQIRPLLASSQIQPATFQTIFDDYRSLNATDLNPSDVASPFCENPTQCSLYDVIWKEDGLSRVKSWKSQPTDASLSRWGL
jgi:hypothetical protein